MSDRLLAGLVHDLRGRVTTFAGLARLLDDDEDSDWFREHLSDEVGRLEATVELLRLLRDDGDRTPDPLSLAEALPQVLELWQRGSGGPLPVELAHDGEAPPVRLVWSAFRRALLILMDEADARARAAGAPAVRVSLRAEGSAAVLGVAWEGTGGVERDDERRERSAALEALFGKLGGRLTEVDGPSGMEVRFPGLGS